jgi:hypothetical protein
MNKVDDLLLKKVIRTRGGNLICIKSLFADHPRGEIQKRESRRRGIGGPTDSGMIFWVFQLLKYYYNQ